MISREQFISALRNLGFTKSKAEDIWAETITASQTHKAGKGVGARPGGRKAKQTELERWVSARARS